MSILGKIGSGLKKVGKVALKVAPYAAMAIPGVGVPLGMAIAGATKAADAKLSGSSWKGALLQGGLGAAGGALGGAGGALSKIGPSSSVLAKLGAGAAGKSVGTGITGKVGSVLGGMASNALGRGGQPLIDTSSGAGTDKSWKGLADMGINAATSRLGSIGNQSGGRGRPSDALTSGSASPRQSFGQSSGNAPGFSYGSNNPNFADSLLAGQRQGVRDQPFRTGYDVMGSMPDATDEIPNPTRSILGRIPAISSPFGSNRRRQQAAY